MHAHNLWIQHLCNVPLGVRFVGRFGSALDMHMHALVWQIWHHLDPSTFRCARMESEFSLRLQGKTIEFDNAGYFIPVRHEHCDS